MTCWASASTCTTRIRKESFAARPGAVIAQRDGAICRATVDGAVWITHLKLARGEEPALKLPAAMVLGERLAGVPEVPLAPDAIVDWPTWRPIRYEEAGGVGFLHFPFYNGAMGTEQCEALRTALRAAKARPTRVIALMGGPDFWSNGIHLHRIEASGRPAEASWENINAIDDLVREIIDTDRQLTIAALQGNAGAGGVFLALAADHVWARTGVILNPHYKGMGNLYGSEYWTYLLPRRVTPDRARGPHAGTPADRCAPSHGRGPRGRPFRGDAGSVSRGGGAAGAGAGGRPRVRAAARGQERRRAADEAVKPLEALPRRGARPDEAQLLRLRSELPRGALPLRLQGAAVADAVLAGAGIV